MSLFGGRGVRWPVLNLPYHRVYPTDMTAEQWHTIRRWLPPSPPIGADRSVDMRRIVDGIFYVSRSGCQWRRLPRTYENWNTTYGYFNRWRKDGTWEKIHDMLRGDVRQQAGRESTPSAAILDSQSVKTTDMVHIAMIQLMLRRLSHTPTGPQLEISL